MAQHRTEPSVNPRIGDAIDACHPRSTVHTQQTGLLSSSRRQPDIVVEAPGRVAALVENKYDSSAGERALEAQCASHVGAVWAGGGPVEAVIGLLSPQRLAHCPEADVGPLIWSETFRYAAWLPDRLGGVRFPASGWISGGIADAAAFIDRVTADALDHSGIADSVRAALAAAADEVSGDPTAPSLFGALLSQAPGEQTMKMAMAIMFNAAVFQAHIAANHASIKSPARMIASGAVRQSVVLGAWQDILKIDYWPIFGIARRLLGAVNNQFAADAMLARLYRQADAVLQNSNAQGLVGQLFGELIGDRKFLAAYYTMPASAALVAELAVERLDVDWSDRDEVSELRIGDLACGTGALLTAAYRLIAERHRLRGGDDVLIHRPLLENGLVGCDILAAAVHLTAARLSGEQPAQDYANTRTWVMPYGDTHAPGGIATRLGSIDLLGQDQQSALWGDGTIGVTAEGDTIDVTADVPDGSLDVVIMNPPFTRSVGHEADRIGVPQPAFAGLGNTDAEQSRMARLLKKAADRAAHRPVAYNGQAGIGSIFADLAHSKLKASGVLALILPASAIAGEAWSGLRGLLAARYEQIQVLSIAEAAIGTTASTSRAFSADTGMAECVIVATKRALLEDDLDGDNATSLAKQVAPADHVILNHRPNSIAEGVEVAKAISAGRRAAAGSLSVGASTFGRVQRQAIGPGVRGHPTGVVNHEISAFALSLEAGVLALPQLVPRDFPICELSQIADRGTYHMDLSANQPDGTPRGPFDIDPLSHRSHYTRVGYPVLWRHDHTQETTIEVLPDSQGSVRDGMQERALARWDGWTTAANARIAGATRLHVNRDFQINSQPLGACLTPTRAIGGRSWPSAQPRIPFTTDAEVGTKEWKEARAEWENANKKALPEWEKALAIWLNTSLGLIARWWVSNRQQNGRANLTITTIGHIPVLNLSNVPEKEKTVRSLADLCDQHLSTPLLPANEAYHDHERQVIDEGVFAALGISRTALGPLGAIREAWCSEPSVHGGKATRP